MEKEVDELIRTLRLINESDDILWLMVYIGFSMGGYGLLRLKLKGSI